MPAVTPEMLIVMGVMLLTIILFVTDKLRVDVIAILILTLLGLIASMPGLEPILTTGQLFSGFASSAVISIIAVMIIGRGLDKTGVMTIIAAVIFRYSGRREGNIMAATSGSVAVLSSFMQNIGAAALFMPVVSRLSTQTGLPISRLLMPMGFSAILGGTLTMVASSPLIALNDLIDAKNATLPAADRLNNLNLFDVTPVGLMLVGCGLLYFMSLGKRLLPSRGIDPSNPTARATGTARYMRRIHGVDAAVREIVVPPGSPIVGFTIDEVQNQYEVRIVATRYNGRSYIEPPTETVITAPATLAVIAEPKPLRTFISEGRLTLRRKLREFRYMLARSIAGIAEIVIPPQSALVGRTASEIRMRKVYGLTLLSILRNGKAIKERLWEMPIQAGDTLLVHTQWTDLAMLERNRDFVVVTSNYPREPQDPYKVALALSFFALSLSLVVLSNIPVPVAFLTGAVGMILFGVLSIDEAYRAISWQTVFLLAGLLPLGAAAATTGVADYLAQGLLQLANDPPAWVLQTLLALLATLLTLIMSNVGATVILVPIAISVALGAGANATMFALTVALAASNSFILPTHQVNALVMGPGKYRVSDYVRVGGIMTLIFLVVVIAVLNLIF
ncbi:MAG: SLC13 family permease [Pseudomonadota bacterium]